MRFVLKHIPSVLVSETFRPNVTHTVTTTVIILLSCCCDWGTTVASFKYPISHSYATGARSPNIATLRTPLLFISEAHNVSRSRVSSP